MLVGISFRPLTGTLLSKQCVISYRYINHNLSVPSRGLSYLNMNPPGGMGLKKNSFRPLTGTLLSKQSLINLKIMQRELSVPSRGLSYLNILWNNK